MIAHITVHTAKLHETVAFYQWLLALPTAANMQTPNGEIVFLGAAETKLELIEDKSAQPIAAKGLSIGFTVDDLDAKIALLDSKHIAHSPVISPVPNVRFVFLTDPNGCNIQLCGH